MGALQLPNLLEPTKQHPTLVSLCRRLEKIVHGRAAQQLLESPETIPEQAGIILLPIWQWRSPAIEVGRKARDRVTGGGLLMPVRTEWAEGNVAVLSAGTTTLTNRSSGLGHAYAGQGHIVVRAGGTFIAGGDDELIEGQPVFSGTGSRAQIIKALKKISEDGNIARWEFISGLESKVSGAIHKAHSAISFELSESSGIVQNMLDETGLDQVVASTMYGEGDRPGPVLRLLELCLTPGRFDRVDPLRFIERHIRRDAESQIRRQLGDPHIGPKIREVARQHSGKDIDTIIAEYRKLYPRDKLSTDRANAALSVSPDVMARAIRKLHNPFVERSADGTLCGWLEAA